MARRNSPGPAEPEAAGAAENEEAAGDEPRAPEPAGAGTDDGVAADAGGAATDGPAAAGAGESGAGESGPGPAVAGGGAAPAESGEEETDPLTAAQRERDEYLALAQRAQADFENFRKRAAKESATAGERAKSGLVGELLPVVDNLERALGSAGDGEGELASGVRLVHSELVAVLARNGVEPFDPGGERFDPALHEALSTREDENAGAGVVVEVVEKGYSLNGSVLRPARVVVSA